MDLSLRAGFEDSVFHAFSTVTTMFFQVYQGMPFMQNLPG